MPAVLQHTTAGTADDAELFMVRAVETGIINVREVKRSDSSCLTANSFFLVLFSHTRVEGQDRSGRT